MARATKASPLRDRADDSLFTLIGDVPDLVKNLVRAELDALKAYAGKVVKHSSFAAILVFAALFFLFWATPAFLAFLIILLALWLPLWASALIVFGFGVLMIVILGAWAYFVHVRAIRKLETPGAAAKADAAIVKEFADEF
ncbi:MAG: phage holin family protein [Microbacterium gubbeenense]|uniref:phage holin family protein n=1 Tax=Microbacterium gubbeenense TaxID=159896 RepID=UPI0003FCE8CF|nr:phage holin family protein [Microbacterium gubbeenense]